jgi:hypothetical protein
MDLGGGPQKQREQVGKVGQESLNWLTMDRKLGIFHLPQPYRHLEASLIGG